MQQNQEERARSTYVGKVSGANGTWAQRGPEEQWGRPIPPSLEILRALCGLQQSATAQRFSKCGERVLPITVERVVDFGKIPT
jgi:hypothetical protein